MSRGRRHLHAHNGWYVVRYDDCPCWALGWSLIPTPLPDESVAALAERRLASAAIARSAALFGRPVMTNAIAGPATATPRGVYR